MDIGAIASSLYSSGLNQQEWFDLRATQRLQQQRQTQETFDAQLAQDDFLSQSNSFELSENVSISPKRFDSNAPAVASLESAITYTGQGRIIPEPADLIGFSLNTTV